MSEHSTEKRQIEQSQQSANQKDQSSQSTSLNLEFLKHLGLSKATRKGVSTQFRKESAAIRAKSAAVCLDQLEWMVEWVKGHVKQGHQLEHLGLENSKQNQLQIQLDSDPNLDLDALLWRWLTTSYDSAQENPKPKQTQAATTASSNQKPSATM